MRMPLFSYFVVMGLTITLALIYISDRIEPLGSPVPTSQIVGIAKPFKPEPERSPYTITGISRLHISRRPRVRPPSRSPPAGLTRSSSNSRWQVLKHRRFPLEVHRAKSNRCAHAHPLNGTTSPIASITRA